MTATTANECSIDFPKPGFVRISEDTDPGIDIERIKKNLTFTTSGIKSYGFGTSNTVCLYNEIGNSIFVPKTFALQEYLTGEWKTSNGYGVDLGFDEVLQASRPDQKEVQDTLIEHFLASFGEDHNPYRGGLLCAGCGCHAKGTKILMADGSIKNVEEIKVGDLLMGVKGFRLVSELHKGNQEMVRIIPRKGEPFIVNLDHILTIKETSNPSKKDIVYDISVRDFINLSNKRKKNALLFKESVPKFSKETPDTSLTIDPYFLGVLLGDGSIIRGVSISKPDKEIFDVCKEQASLHGLSIRIDGSSCPTYHLHVKKNTNSVNPLILKLKDMGLYGKHSRNKFIPDIYLKSSWNSRIKLLAGLIDTDGYYANKSFEFSSSSKELAENFTFLSRSLGFYCSIKEKIVDYSSYWICRINGPVDTIPTRILRKKAEKRLINKDPLVCSFTYELLPNDDFYGFTLDGDGRYLLHDFTVTHNSGKTVMGLKLAHILGRTTLVMVHKEFLIKQWIERIEQFLDVPSDQIGRIQGNKCNFEGKSIVLGMIHSLAQRQYTPDMYNYFGTILVDEAHRISAPMFSQALPRFPAKNVIGLTATPRRGDGLEDVFHYLIGPVLSKIDSINTVEPTIYQVGFNSYCPEQKYMSRNKKTGKVKKIYLAKLINILSENPRRNEYIVTEMTKALSKGRRVLVFSDRLEHLAVLKTGLEQVMPTVTTGYYVGGMKPHEWEKSAQCDAIFATYAMGKEGLDIPAVDTLYMATPKSDVEQAIGRVVRECFGKKDPIVVDIVDINDTCESFAQKRLQQYNKLGYTVKCI